MSLVMNNCTNNGDLIEYNEPDSNENANQVNINLELPLSEGNSQNDFDNHDLLNEHIVNEENRNPNYDYQEASNCEQNCLNTIIKHKYNKAFKRPLFRGNKIKIINRIKKELLEHYIKLDYSVHGAPEWAKTISAKAVNILKECVHPEVKFTVQTIILNNQDTDIFHLDASCYSDKRHDNMFYISQNKRGLSIIILFVFCITI